MTHLRRTIAALAIVMLLSVDTWATECVTVTCEETER
jgi:hypothetical protein